MSNVYDAVATNGTLPVINNPIGVIQSFLDVNGNALALPLTILDTNPRKTPPYAAPSSLNSAQQYLAVVPFKVRAAGIVTCLPSEAEFQIRFSFRYGSTGTPSIFALLANGSNGQVQNQVQSWRADMTFLWDSQSQIALGTWMSQVLPGEGGSFWLTSSLGSPASIVTSPSNPLSSIQLLIGGMCLGAQSITLAEFSVGLID